MLADGSLDRRRVRLEVRPSWMLRRRDDIVEIEAEIEVAEIVSLDLWREVMGPRRHDDRA